MCPECGGVFQVKPRHVTANPATPGSPSLRARHRSKRRSGPVVWVVVGLTLSVALALLTAVLYRQRGPAPVISDEFRSAEHNYSVRPPGPPWKRDDELAKRLGGVLAFRLASLDAVVVLVVRDYPKTIPTAGELRDTIIARLRQYPVSVLHFEDKSEGATFGGRPASRLVFQGQVDNVPASGDVHYLAHQGKAYWLVRWCPSTDVEKVAGGLADLAGRFTLLDLRPDWHPEVHSFSGTAARYSLTAEGNRWVKAPYPPASYDPAADLALVGRLQDGDAATRAQLLVLMLPSIDDPVQAATSHLLARQKEIYPDTKMTVLPGGSNQHDVVGLRLDTTKERAIFVLMRVVRSESRLIVATVECDFARRDVWEEEFRKLLTTFRPAN
jgi:hypothetical protein